MIRLLAFLALLLAWTGPLFGQNPLYDVIYNKKNSRLAVTAMSSTVPTSGFLAVRVEAQNNETVPITWRFNFTSKDVQWASDGNRLSSQFSLTCLAGEGKTVEFMVPLVTHFQNHGEPTVEVEILASPPLFKGLAEMNNGKDQNWPDILMSDTLATPNLGPLQSRSSSRGRRGLVKGRIQVETFAGSFLPQTLSSDWRAYSGTDILMMTATDWEEIPPGAKTAILQWNRLGGRLIIYAKSPSTSLLSLGIVSSDVEAASTTTRSWGTVELIMHDGLLLDVPETLSLVQSGGTVQARSETVRKGNRNSWPLQAQFGTRNFNATFSILILVAFAIVVGPINLFVFAKSTQRHRLFITTPIISLAASLLLIIIIFAQDGLGGIGHRIALVESRPDENKLYIQQEQIARTGVLFGTSFALADHTVLSPIALESSRMARVTLQNDGGDSRYRILQEEQNKLNYSGDWFQSRSEYGHLATSIETTRGRLELLSNTGAPTLTSTFEFPLEKIYYISSDNTYWTNESPLISGRKVTLKPAPPLEYREWILQVSKNLTQDSATRLKQASRGRNHFVATTSEGPFIETLASLRWAESLAIMTGPVVEP